MSCAVFARSRTRPGQAAACFGGRCRPHEPRSPRPDRRARRQVDDGSRGEFGKEIELRAQFEACASLPRGEPLERQVADCIRRLEVGWHGSQDGWGDSFDEASLDRPSAAPTDGHSSGEENPCEQAESWRGGHYHRPPG